jgi:hypothetical protein
MSFHKGVGQSWSFGCTFSWNLECSAFGWGPPTGWSDKLGGPFPSSPTLPVRVCLWHLPRYYTHTRILGPEGGGSEENSG